MKKKVILAIGAHPDDIEIGCGGTIKKHVLKGDDVYYVIATNGEKGGDGDERVSEAKKAAQLMGVKGIDFLNIKDTFVTHDGYVVHLLDMNIAKSSLSASRNMKNSIFYYEAPSTTLEFTPIAFSGITETFESKMECINQFVSQEKKDYVERQAIVDLSKFRGKMINVEYAEAFEVVRLIEW